MKQLFECCVAMATNQMTIKCNNNVIKSDCWLKFLKMLENEIFFVWRRLLRIPVRILMDSWGFFSSCRFRLPFIRSIDVSNSWERKIAPGVQMIPLHLDWSNPPAPSPRPLIPLTHPQLPVGELRTRARTAKARSNRRKEKSAESAEKRGNPGKQ